MYVYLIKSGNKEKAPIKIGMSDDPEKRLKQLQTGNPQILQLMMSIKCKSRDHAFRLEKTMHKLLRGSNIVNEWYSAFTSNVYKSITLLANNPDYENVIKNSGFQKAKVRKSAAEKEAKKRLNKAVVTVEHELVLIDKLKSRDNEIEYLLAKLRKRKVEAGIFRDKLRELGFDCKNIDKLLGRK